VVNDDIFVPPSSPKPNNHTTVQHVNDTDFMNDHEPARTPEPLLTDDLNGDDGTSDPDDDSLPSLGDPKHKFFSEMTLPSISLIDVAAFKWLINVGEEIYTINIQPTSDYLDIEALQAVSHQSTPTSTLHSEPLPTKKEELFAKFVPEAYQDFFDVFS